MAAAQSVRRLTGENEVDGRARCNGECGEWGTGVLSRRSDENEERGGHDSLYRSCNEHRSMKQQKMFWYLDAQIYAAAPWPMIGADSAGGNVADQGESCFSASPGCCSFANSRCHRVSRG